MIPVVTNFDWPSAGVIQPQKGFVNSSQGGRIAAPDFLRGAIVEAAREKPFLGICIGLQMLFEHSEEGDTPGLALLRGRVRRFPVAEMVDGEGRKLKVPHMGWNEVH